MAADAAANKRSGRGIVWLAVACTVIGGLGYVIFHRPHTVTVAQVAAELPAAAPPVAPASPTAPSAELAPPPGPVAPATSNEPASAASAGPAASADAPTSGMITVTVNSSPPKALFLSPSGKQVGVAPFVVQLKPGERHAYEVGLPGHITRKLVLDGTKTELTVGLNEDPGTFIRRSPAF